MVHCNLWSILELNVKQSRVAFFTIAILKERGRTTENIETTVIFFLFTLLNPHSNNHACTNTIIARPVKNKPKYLKKHYFLRKKILIILLFHTTPVKTRRNGHLRLYSMHWISGEIKETKKTSKRISCSYTNLLWKKGSSILSFICMCII